MRASNPSTTTTQQYCAALKRSPTASLKESAFFFFWFLLWVKFKTGPLDREHQCVALRRPDSVSSIMNRHMSWWSMESTHCKRWAWGDMFSGRLPRFVLAWHSGGHGWTKWGRRNTYSQFPQIRGRSSLRRSQRGEKGTVLWTEKLINEKDRRGNEFKPAGQLERSQQRSPGQMFDLERRDKITTFKCIRWATLRQLLNDFNLNWKSYLLYGCTPILYPWF